MIEAVRNVYRGKLLFLPSSPISSNLFSFIPSLCGSWMHYYFRKQFLSFWAFEELNPDVLGLCFKVHSWLASVARVGGREGKRKGGRVGGRGRREGEKEGRVCVVAFGFCKDSSYLKNDPSCKLTLPETVIRTFRMRRCKVRPGQVT